MSLMPVFSTGNISIEISAGNQPTLSTLATAAGWTGNGNLLFRVTGDIGGPLTQDIDSSFEVRIVVDGSITGFGGDGGQPSDSPEFPNQGEDGGVGVDVQYPCVIENNGTIAGGGDGLSATGTAGGLIAGGNGGGAGLPVGAGSFGINGGADGQDGTATTGGAGGSPGGKDGGDLGDAAAITGFADVTYTGAGTLIGGTS